MRGRMRLVIPAVAAVLAALALQSCGNPFGARPGEPRFTPTVSNLKVSRSSVFCEIEVNFSFSYRDPQNDILRVHLTLVGDTNGGFFEETIGWSEEGRIVIKPYGPTFGRASIPFSFSCDDQPLGAYTISINVDDAKGHISNTIVSSIDLL